MVTERQVKLPCGKRCCLLANEVLSLREIADILSLRHEALKRLTFLSERNERARKECPEQSEGERFFRIQGSPWYPRGAVIYVAGIDD